eukprot:Blabericola_migrator_1__1477@NODE_1390_length_4637_cov_95_265427_g930_i0_p2_GENE_NODE_1390_length_4637_cov_95_265427_g930_i0NODE_1390_length_4637_cov_95_265427_g930_i0_p2_ORF_typecomplete_len562_score136_63PRP21_like_P/PF12230_8/2_3e02PRP21_like_P/PF12230_8/8_8e45Surp/PF01805_20/3e13Surp/PF01805_20/1_7e18_NODE_1390_length_4637_cov_95_265427_g930_i02421687
MIRDPESSERFGFLMPGHPYRPYYELKLNEARTGKVEAPPPAIPQAIVEMRKKEEEKKEKLLMLKSYGERKDVDDSSEDENVAEMEEPVEEAPPDEDRFLLRHPYIAAIDQEIVKLTAQFVAVNDKPFLAGLIQRERNNPQFDFLKPTHPTHAYFTALIQSYKECFSPAPEVLDKVNKYAGKAPLKKGQDVPIPKEAEVLKYIVGKMRKRQKWNEKQDLERKAREEQEAGERAAMAAIDWDNFVVVETIVFTEADSQVALPVPLKNLEARDTSALGATTTDGQAPIPMAQQREKPDLPSISRAPQPQSSDSQISLMRPVEQPVPMIEPPQRRPSPEVTATAATSVPTTTTMMDGQEATVVLKPDYVRRGKRGAAGTRTLLQKCPITGQLVPPDQMEKHLRVILMDPQWKRQRDELLARAQREKVMSPEMDVEANIAQFVMKRPDLFGTVEDEVIVNRCDNITHVFSLQLMEHAPPKKRSNV